MPNDAMGINDTLSGTLILVFLALPVVGALLAALAPPPGFRISRFACEMVAASLVLLAVLVLLASRVTPVALTLSRVDLPTGSSLGFTLIVDRITSALLLPITMAEAAIVVTSTAYIPKGRHTQGYFALVWLSIAALNGTLLAGDLATTFAAGCLASMALMLLVGLNFGNEGAAAALKLVSITGVAAIVGLGATWLTLAEVPSLEFSSLASQAERLRRSEWQPALTALLVALAVRAGLAPGHTWLTTAGPVSLPTVGALICGVSLVGAAITLIRVLVESFPFRQDWYTMVGAFGAATIVVGSLGVIRQSELLRALPSLSIVQVGLAAIALAVPGVGAPLAVFQLTHATIVLTLLYLAVGWARTPNGLTPLPRLWRDRPIAAFGLLVGGLAIAALPASSGYLARTFLVASAVADDDPLAVLRLAAVVFGTILTTWYVLRVLWQPSAQADDLVDGEPTSLDEPASSPRGVNPSAGLAGPASDAGGQWKSGSRSLPLGASAALAALILPCLALGFDGVAWWTHLSTLLRSANQPVADPPFVSMLAGHAILLLAIGSAVVLRAVEVGRAPEPLQSSLRGVGERLTPLRWLGKQYGRLADTGRIDPYNLVGMVVGAAAYLCVFVTDNTLGRIGSKM